MNAKLLASIAAVLLTAVCSESKYVCPRNMTAVGCEPCNQYCNEEQMFCVLSCKEGNYCRCDTGYIFYSKTKPVCILKEDCPPAPPKCKT